eukprot:jgi/Chlat1/5790/Chrsp387S00875
MGEVQIIAAMAAADSPMLEPEPDDVQEEMTVKLLAGLDVSDIEAQAEAAASRCMLPETGVHTVVVAVDGSAAASNALSFALNHILHAGDKVVLVHAVEDLHNIVPFKWHELHPKRTHAKRQAVLDEIAEQIGRDVATAAASQLQTAQVLHDYQIHVASGDPRQVIVDACKAVHATLLVMGTRGRGTLSRHVLLM